MFNNRADFYRGDFLGDTLYSNFSVDILWIFYDNFLNFFFIYFTKPLCETEDKFILSCMHVSSIINLPRVVILALEGKSFSENRKSSFFAQSSWLQSRTLWFIRAWHRTVLALTLKVTEPAVVCRICIRERIHKRVATRCFYSIQTRICYAIHACTEKTSFGVRLNWKFKKILNI